MPPRSGTQARQTPGGTDCSGQQLAALQGGADSSRLIPEEKRTRQACLSLQFLLLP